MPKRDWQTVVDSWEASRPGRMNVRKLVHLAMRMDQVDVDNIAKQIYNDKLSAYEDSMSDLAQRMGCDRQGMADGKAKSRIHEQSQDEAAGIVNTYNYDLTSAIDDIRSQNAKANRNTYVKGLVDWNTNRTDWKNLQISLHNRMEWKSQATHDFLSMNNIDGFAQLLPASHAVCDTCKYWISRGKVPISEVRTVVAKWPPHLNCIHSWMLEPVNSLDCDELWLGAEPQGYTVKEVSAYA